MRHLSFVKEGLEQCELAREVRQFLSRPALF